MHSIAQTVFAAFLSAAVLAGPVIAAAAVSMDSATSRFAAPMCAMPDIACGNGKSATAMLFALH